MGYLGYHYQPTNEMTSYIYKKIQYNRTQSSFQVFKDLSLNLFMWRHLDTNSVLLFSKVAGSAWAITNFSVIHRSQCLVPHRYGAAVATMDHVISYGFSPSFSCQIYFDSTVPLSFGLFRSEAVWLLQRSLNGGSERP